MKAQRGNRIRRYVAVGALLGSLTQGCATTGSGARGAPPVNDHVAVTKSILDPVFAGGDFQPLFDRLADDVVLQVAILGKPASREFHGKRAVMAFFLNEGDVTGILQETPHEYFGSAERVVVRGANDRDSRKAAVRARGRGHAAVVDFRNGRIARFLVVEDVPTVVDAYRRGIAEQ